MSDQIKDLVKRAKQNPTRDNIVEMWKQIFLLKAWYFIPSRADNGPDTPKLIELENQTTIPIFTNVRRLRDFWKTRDEHGDEDLPLLPLDPLESVNRITEHSSLIDFVSFNPTTSSSIKVPTQALIKYADYFNLPLESTK